jgi:hypothetical protein
MPEPEDVHHAWFGLPMPVRFSKCSPGPRGQKKRAWRSPGPLICSLSSRGSSSCSQRARSRPGDLYSRCQRTRAFSSPSGSGRHAGMPISRLASLGSWRVHACSSPIGKTTGQADGLSSGQFVQLADGAGRGRLRRACEASLP